MDWAICWNKSTSSFFKFSLQHTESTLFSLQRDKSKAYLCGCRQHGLEETAPDPEADLHHGSGLTTYQLHNYLQAHSLSGSWFPSIKQGQKCMPKLRATGNVNDTAPCPQQLKTKPRDTSCSGGGSVLPRGAQDMSGHMCICHNVTCGQRPGVLSVQKCEGESHSQESAGPKH